MWTRTLQQYCSGPVDGNLYAIVKKTPDGSWVEVSSGGEDSGCGASSNVGYKPDTLTLAESGPTEQPPVAPEQHQEQQPDLTGGQPGADIDDLLEDLLGLGALESPTSSTPPLPPPVELEPQPPPPPATSTERERLLVEELQRTRRKLRRRLRRLRRGSEASHQRDSYSRPADAEGAERWPAETGEQHQNHYPHHHQQHHRNHDNGTHTKSQHHQHHAHQQSETQHHGRYFSSPDGDIQYRSGRADDFGPEMWQQPPVWEKRYRTAAAAPHGEGRHRGSRQQRLSESQADNPQLKPSGPQQPTDGGTRSQRQSRSGFDSSALDKSRDLLESKLRELSAEMGRTRAKLMTSQSPRSVEASPLMAPRGPPALQLRPPSPELPEEFKPYQEVETVTMKPIGRGIHDLPSVSQQLPVKSQPVSVNEPNRRLGSNAYDNTSGSLTPTAAAANQRAPTKPNTSSDNQSEERTPTNLPQPIRIDRLRRQQPTKAQINNTEPQKQPISSQQHQATNQRPAVSGSVSVPTPEEPSINQFLSPPQPNALATGSDAAKASMHLWYRPTITREEAINQLSRAPPGSFLVRDSNSFPGAFGLAIRVSGQPPPPPPDQQSVRHFLVEPAAGGVRLRGCANEPTFASLEALVWQHSVEPLALPCRLVLPSLETSAAPPPASASATGVYDQPDKIAAAAAAAAAAEASASVSTSSINSMSGGATVFSVVYIGSVNVESLTGSDAVTRAVDALLGNTGGPMATTTSECQLKVSSEGVTLTDLQRRLFFRRHYPMSALLHCGLDAKDRRLTNAPASSRGPLERQARPRLFGLVARTADGSHGCTLLCELDPLQPAPVMVSLVNQQLLSGGGMG